MKRIRSVLRGREGMTLVELIVSAGLLCLVIAVFSASLRPAAEVSRRTQELNSAELIADDLLETVRSEVETATDYIIKCYDNGADITDQTGSSRGSAVEFGTSNAVELLTADGCAETAIMVGSRAAGTEAAVEKGYLLERYYDNSTGVFYSKNADGTPCARARADLCKGLLHGSPRRSVLRARRVRPHRHRHRDHLPRRGYDRRGLFGLAPHRPAVRHPGQDRRHGAAASGGIKKSVIPRSTAGFTEIEKQKTKFGGTRS